jgi:hypothetical protein
MFGLESSSSHQRGASGKELCIIGPYHPCHPPIFDLITSFKVRKPFDRESVTQLLLYVF